MNMLAGKKTQETRMLDKAETKARETRERNDGRNAHQAAEKKLTRNKPMMVKKAHQGIGSGKWVSDWAKKSRCQNTSSPKATTPWEKRKRRMVVA